MYIYYVLRGTQAEKAIELEGDIDEEHFPEVDLGDGPVIINYLVKKLQAEGIRGSWEACELTDSFFNREDHYMYYNDRWMRRSDTPWRKDKGY